MTLHYYHFDATLRCQPLSHWCWWYVIAIDYAILPFAPLWLRQSHLPPHWHLLRCWYYVYYAIIWFWDIITFDAAIIDFRHLIFSLPFSLALFRMRLILMPFMFLHAITPLRQMPFTPLIDYHYYIAFLRQLHFFFHYLRHYELRRCLFLWLIIVFHLRHYLRHLSLRFHWIFNILAPLYAITIIDIIIAILFSLHYDIISLRFRRCCFMSLIYYAIDFI